MRRLLVAVTLVAAITLAVVLSAAQSPTSVATYKIEFDNIFGLTEGGDMRVAGVRAGKTPTFELTNDERPKALVTAEIQKPGFTPFRADAHCDIRQESLIGTYYVSCQPGKSPRTLPDGAVIPIEQTTSTIPVDLINGIMRRPYKERFRIILAELGTGLAGRPQDIAEVLRRAHPGLRETSKTLRVLGDQNDTIKKLIRDGDTVVEELEANKNDVARFVKEAGETAEIASTRTPDIRRGFQLLPTFLRELRPTMARLGEFSDATVPTLIDLRNSAPELERFLVETEPFARATRPALRSLGRASVEGLEAVEESDEEIRQLRRLAEPLPQRGSAPDEQGVVRPLRQFLVSLDDRKRSIEEDRRAGRTAPPNPDPTAYTSGQGFTGFESLMQVQQNLTLAVNLFDDTSHFLRVLILPDQECGRYTARPTESQLRRCTSYQGDYQPCVPTKDQPDAEIFNRPEICNGTTHGLEEESDSEGESSGDREPARKRAGTTGGLEESAPSESGRAPAGGSPTTRTPQPSTDKRPPSVPKPGAPAPDAGSAGGADTDAQMLDYLLGQ